MRERLKVMLPFLGLLILTIVFSIKAPDTFPTRRNILNVVRRSSPYVITAVGMTFVIISGGIDLSVGSIVAVAGVCGAMAMARTGSIAVGVLAGMATGTPCLEAKPCAARVGCPSESKATLAGGPTTSSTVSSWQSGIPEAKIVNRLGVPRVLTSSAARPFPASPSLRSALICSNAGRT